MKFMLAGVAAIAVFAAAFFGASRIGSGTTTSVAATGTVSRPPNVLYGHIKSLTRTHGRFELRFDPAWLLTGVAAERASQQDTGSTDVPNDSYTVDESHRLFTFVVPENARATVVTRRSMAAPVSVGELAQIVAGRNPKHRALLEPRAGFWIEIGEKYPNGAVVLYQQYQP